jgi:hypothetical protein
VNPFADDGSQAKRQAEIQARMDEQSRYNREMSMQQASMSQQPYYQDQGGGGGYGGYEPMPIPIAPGEAPAAPAAAPTQMVMPGRSQTPEVGTGWADFAARPAGPEGLGLSRQSVQMQQLRASRAGGGLY